MEEVLDWNTIFVRVVHDHITLGYVERWHKRKAVKRLLKKWGYTIKRESLRFEEHNDRWFVVVKKGKLPREHG